MIIITNWNEILASPLSEGLKSDIKTFYKELVHDNMGEDHLTYDFTEIGKIAVLETSDDINHLPEIGFYADTIFLLDKIVEAVDDVLADGINYYRVTILLNDAQGVVLYLYQKKIKEGKTKQQALVCVMRRLVNIIFGMMKSGSAYRMPIVEVQTPNNNLNKLAEEKVA